MEKKANVENSMQKKGLWILKSLLCAYLVTGVLLLILTVLLTNVDWRKNMFQQGF